MTGLLDDVLVLDLTRFLSGPYATLMLAGMGAKVIKIDDPVGGDPTAGAPPFAGGAGASFDRRDPRDLGIAYLKRARGKRSVTVNLKHSGGRDLFLRLAEHADVVVENFRPGVAQRLGIDHPTLAQRNPRLVYCSLTGYGSTGPDRHLKAYDLMVQAASGLMGISGDPQGGPVKTATAFSDMLSGVHAAMGILAALHERGRSGEGQWVDVSMVECLFSMMMDEPLDCYSALGLEPRQGNRIMRFSPFNAYRAADGWVTIGVATPGEWAALARTMGREELAGHADFARVEWRIANNDRVDGVVAAWAAKRPVADIVRALGAADVACAPVRMPRDALAWPHLQERGAMRALLRPDRSDTGAVAAELPLRFSRSHAAHDVPAGVPGADTEQVLAQLLEMSAAQVAALRAQGTV